ncbi:MAG: hypothetical protein LBG30_00710 [Odoribacteraceae bacterium]|jgi:TPR repeat protein|nr:hypothetical protein [Odoribacteraceae bacterium]
MSNKRPGKQRDSYAHFLSSNKRLPNAQGGDRSHVLSFGSQVEAWLRAGGKAYERGDYRSAVTWLRKAANANHPHAMMYLATIYMSGGNGVKQSTEMSVEYLQQACDQGDPTALLHLGGLYIGCDGVISINIPAAYHCFQKAVEIGCSSCIGYDLVDSLFYRTGDEKLSDEQWQYFQNGIRARALYNEAIGILADDKTRGEQLLIEAADLDFTAAKCELGILYRAAGDTERALPLLIEAAQNDIPDALGDLLDYSVERGVREDVVLIFEKLVKGGNITDPDLLKCENALLVLEPSRLLPETARAAYREGVEIFETKGPEPAYARLLEAANAGHARAQLMMGLYYAHRDRVIPDDLPDPRGWFSMAAKQGCIEACLHLGAALYAGERIDRNQTLGFKLISKAARSGIIPEDMLTGVEWFITSDQNNIKYTRP